MEFPEPVGGQQKRPFFMLVAMAGAVLIAGNAAAQSLPPGVDAFILGADGLVQAAEERARLGRAIDRTNIIREALSRKLKSAQSGEDISLESLNLKSLLCGVRVNDAIFVARRNYLRAVSAKIGEVGKPSQIDNIATAIAVLFSSYSIDVGQIPDEDSDAWERLVAQIASRCDGDLKRRSPAARRPV